MVIGSFQRTVTTQLLIQEPDEVNLIDPFVADEETEAKCDYVMGPLTSNKPPVAKQELVLGIRPSRFRCSASFHMCPSAFSIIF